MNVSDLCDAYREKYLKVDKETHRLLGRIEDLRREAEELREIAVPHQDLP